MTTRTNALSEKQFGLWTFILSECVIFSAYFVIFMLYRMHDAEGFRSAQTQLSPAFGMLNTIVLLTSSWQIALSVQGARSGMHAAAARRAIITLGLGVVFILSKLTEWTRESRSGHTFGTNDFFSFYFFLTGIHLVHVFIGFAFIAAAIRNLRGDEASAESIEAAATYWHMVDFLWVVIFALLYVAG